MRRARTAALPPCDLRDLVRALNEDALVVERRVRLFAVGARYALAEFERQVAPLDLSDRRHRSVAEACGLDDLVAFVERMKKALGEVVDC